jgi:hypothetical protein
MPRSALHLLLIRDGVYFAALLSVFLLPDPYGVLLLVFVLAVAAPRFEKAIRESGSELKQTEKHIYLGANVIWIGILLSLLIRWAVRHNSKTAWLITGLAVTALLIVFLVNATNLYRRTFYFSNDTVKLFFVFGCVTLLALASQWLFNIGSHHEPILSNPVSRLAAPILLLGLLYFFVLRRRRIFFPNVSWLTISIMIVVFLSVFIAVLLRL